MTIIEKQFIDEDGNDTLSVIIKSACCTKRYLIWRQNNNYFDVSKLEYVSAGMRISLDIALAQKAQEDAQKVR